MFVAISKPTGIIYKLNMNGGYAYNKSVEHMPDTSIYSFVDIT